MGYITATRQIAEHIAKAGWGFTSEKTTFTHRMKFNAE
jgi:hypothetical protein